MKDVIEMDFEKKYKNPEMTNRPKMRWWLPGAFMEDEEIKREIISLVEAGYGGAEILHFIPVPTTDVSPEKYEEYYFGSEKWNHCMKVALEAAIEYNFKLDFTIGPLWPIATPAIMNFEDERTAHGLHVGTSDFIGSFQGKLPLPETIDSERKSRLIAVSVAKKSKGSKVGVVATYDHKSVRAVQVNGQDGIVEWKAPDNDEWTLFAYWDQPTAQKNDATQSPVIDHLSEESTRAVIDYWDSSLLRDPYIKGLYEKNGGDLFCDSLEINATMLGGMYDSKPYPVILWTKDLLLEFKERRGYDLTPYLPALFIKGMFQHSDTRNLDKPSEYEFIDPIFNRQVRNDYYQTLTDLVNEKHIAVLQSWAHSHNMQLRYQIYGLPTEMTSGLMYVDVPETESLGFKDNTESVRLLSGAAHMARKPIYSYELGAVLGKAYQQQWTGHNGVLWQMHQALAGGVNQVVLHGMSYNSKSVIGPVEPFFKWPGLSLMGTSYSNEWGDRQPIWKHSRMLTDYISRLQYILRLGRPRVDLAIYRHEYDGVNYSMQEEPSLLQKAGYTYDYISAVLLQLETANVGYVDGKPVLDPDGAAYKAIVVDSPFNRETGECKPPQGNVKVLEKFIQLASEGLPIFWVGEEMLTDISYSDYNQYEKLKDLYEKLISYSNVYNIKKEGLSELSIEKAFEAIGNGVNLVSLRRQTDSADFYFVYNQDKKNEFAGEISLVGEGSPYEFDLWSGEIVAINSYRNANNVNIFNIELEPCETKVFALGKFNANSKSLINGVKNILLLNEWKLKIESWEPGDSPNSTIINTYEYDIDRLVPWKEISRLERVSGVGSYETKVQIPYSVSDAILQLGGSTDTVQVIVNGERLNVNQFSKTVNITPYLIKGDNIIQIEVATTLNNALSVFDKKKELVDYGLEGPVELILTSTK